MTLTVDLKKDSYDIIIEKNILSKAGEYLSLDRKVLVVTDSGVPEQYAKTVLNRCRQGVLFVLPTGESGKSLAYFEKMMGVMLENGFTRSDAVVAVGGGVVGDLAGFAASCFMRGVDFYNIPTTLLSQVDSSVGGKTAVNFGGVKNIVGAFYQPKKVLIDPALLQTLQRRQWANGLCEALKMSVTCDERLFSLLENGNVEENIEDILIAAVKIKIDVVSADEKEKNLRKVLNFGHTLGHGIEVVSGLYHGECVSLGMLPMCGERAKGRVEKVLKKLSLPVRFAFDLDAAFAAVCHDKKARDGKIDIVRVEDIGSFAFESVEKDCLKSLLAEVLP